MPEKTVCKTYSLPPDIARWIADTAKGKRRSAASIVTEVIMIAMKKEYGEKISPLDPYYAPRSDILEWLDGIAKKRRCSVGHLITTFLLDIKKQTAQ